MSRAQVLIALVLQGEQSLVYQKSWYDDQANELGRDPRNQFVDA